MHNKQWALWLFLFGGLSIITGCVQSPSQPEQKNATAAQQSTSSLATYPLENTEWQLDGFYEGSAQISGKATLTLNSDSQQIAGFAGCNRYFGQYQRSEDSLQFYQMGATRKLCQDMTEEDLFFKFMMRINRFEVQKNRLTLFRGQRPMMQFIATGAPPETPSASATDIQGTLLLSEPETPDKDEMLNVVLEDINPLDNTTTLVSEWNQPVSQVSESPPWSFTLNYSPQQLQLGHQYRLKATIKHPETHRISWITTEPYPYVPGADESYRLVLKPLAKARKHFEQTQQYQCGKDRIDILYIGQKALKLSSPRGKWILQKNVRSSALKYENAQVSFSIQADQSDQAELRYRGERLQKCTLIVSPAAPADAKPNLLERLLSQ